MRLTIFAGLAAFARAADFDDEDLNFLRLLSSNASNPNATATNAPTTSAMNTTMAPGNTTPAPTTQPATTAAGNATTPAATTPAAGGNATTAAATTAAATTAAATTAAATTAASGNGTATTAAATTAAATTAAGGVETTPAPSQPSETMPPVSTDTFCTAETYIAMGMSVPATITARTGVAMADCDGADGPDCKTADTCWLRYGPGSDAQANLDKCTGTGTAYSCGTSEFITFWESMPMWHPTKSALLGFCCGYPPNFMSKFMENPKSGGQMTLSRYSDSQCTTLSDTSTMDYDDASLFTGATATRTFNLGTCYNWAGLEGMNMRISACNGTGESDGGMYLREMHFTSTCDAIMSADIDKQRDCKAKDRRRRLTNHTGGSGTEYETMVCSGGTTVANMEIVSDTSVKIEGLTAGMTATQKTSIITITADKVVEAVAAAAAVGTTVKVSETGTGLLAASRRRRLSQRRLGAHDVGSVVTVTKTTVPTAQAKAVQSTLVDAAATGTLEGDTLGAAVVTALKADTSLASITGNITAKATVTVSEPVIPVATTGGGGGSGTTSGAITEYLSYAAGFVVAAAMLM